MFQVRKTNLHELGTLRPGRSPAPGAARAAAVVTARTGAGPGLARPGEAQRTSEVRRTYGMWALGSWISVVKLIFNELNNLKGLQKSGFNVDLSEILLGSYNIYIP